MEKTIIGAVYGPNGDDLEFYDRLCTLMSSINNNNIILGGDWNATWDNSNVNINLDTLNMANIPSKKRSDKIINMAKDLKLTDAFRIFYPNKREYTFIPSGINQMNRSRLDFFLYLNNLPHLAITVTLPTL